LTADRDIWRETLSYEAEIADRSAVAVTRTHPIRVLSRTRGQEGASLVEFAILLVPFMILVMGMFSGGLAYNRQIALREAAREGARYGATVAQNQSFTSGTWASNVRDVVVARSENELTTSQVCVALVDNDSSGVPVAVTTTGNHTVGATDPSGACDPGDTNDIGKRVQVTVRSTADIEALVFSYTQNLSAKAVSKFEGT
jgi:Flp pilus assembly protein TadG